MRVSAVLVVAGLIVGPAFADWPHVVKWDQTVYGLDDWAAASWIDYDTPSDALTADDYFCDGLIEHNWITDLEFYGYSYYGNQYIDFFRVNFWTDVAASPDDESHPGDLLYSYDVGAADPEDPLKIGWYQPDPTNDPYKFKIDLPEDQWFYQGPGEKVLWVSIQGVMATDGAFDAFYWFFQDRAFPVFGDDAAFWSDYFGYPPWWNWGFPSSDYAVGPDLYDGIFPPDWFNSADMAFRLTAIPEPMSVLILALGATALLRRR
jgi:hypothetical protein